MVWCKSSMYGVNRANRAGQQRLQNRGLPEGPETLAHSFLLRSNICCAQPVSTSTEAPPTRFLGTTTEALQKGR